MDSISVPYFQLDTGNPVTLSMPEFEPSELIWRKGPAVEPLATTEEEEEVLVGEDDMAEWLRFFCDGANDVGSANLNGSQTAVGSNHSPPPVLSDFQVPPPVFLAKDAESDCNVVSSEVRRKGKEKLCSEGHSEVTNIGFNEKRKDALPKSVASRKLHATEVHNLSERRRRCRINEKMKILQDLVPASNKLDKASVLDEVIAYVKFLQMQVKMMARGPPYMQPVRSMGIGMGEPGMNPFGPAIPYLHINQPVQVPMLQMRHHQHNMAAAMFPYSLSGDPYRCPVVVPGQVQVFPQHLTANKKTEKRKGG